jgi:hypothetical protein
MDFYSIFIENEFFDGYPTKTCRLDFTLCFTYTRLRGIVMVYVPSAKLNNFCCYTDYEPDKSMRLRGGKTPTGLMLVSRLMELIHDPTSFVKFRNLESSQATNDTGRSLQLVISEMIRTEMVPMSPVVLNKENLRLLEERETKRLAVLEHSGEDENEQIAGESDDEGNVVSSVYASEDAREDDSTDSSSSGQEDEFNGESVAGAVDEVSDDEASMENSSSESEDDADDDIPVAHTLKRRKVCRVSSAEEKTCAASLERVARLNKETAVIAERTAVANRETALANKETALANKETALASERTALINQGVAIETGHPVKCQPRPVPVARVPRTTARAVPSARTTVPSARITVPSARTTVPSARTTVPSARTERTERTARTARTADGPFCPPRAPVDDALRVAVFTKRLARGVMRLFPCGECGVDLHEGTAVLDDQGFVGCEGCWERGRATGTRRVRALKRRAVRWEEEQLARTLSPCFVCATELDFFEAQVGHDVAHVLGGSLNLSNLEVVCVACNLFMGETRFLAAREAHQSALRLRKTVDQKAGQLCRKSGSACHDAPRLPASHMLRSSSGDTRGRMEVWCAVSRGLVALVLPDFSGVSWLDGRSRPDSRLTQNILAQLRVAAEQAQAHRADILSLEDGE